MNEPAVPGRVVVLNGTSSSGNSSIAARLVERLETPHYHFQRDAFDAMRVPRATSEADLEMALDRKVRGFHPAVAGMASAGNNLVVDHVLRDSARVSDFVSKLSDDRCWPACVVACRSCGAGSANVVTA